MGRPKKEISIKSTPEEIVEAVVEHTKDIPAKIAPITEHFGNGDLNVLRQNQ